MRCDDWLLCSRILEPGCCHIVGTLEKRTLYTTENMARILQALQEYYVPQAALRHVQLSRTSHLGPLWSAWWRIFFLKTRDTSLLDSLSSQTVLVISVGGSKPLKDLDWLDDSAQPGATSAGVEGAKPFSKSKLQALGIRNCTSCAHVDQNCILRMQHLHPLFCLKSLLDQMPSLILML